MKTVFLFAVTALASASADGQPTPTEIDASSVLKRVRTIPLAHVKGRMDHLTLNATGDTLYLAALENDSLEVVDLRAGKHTKSVPGLKEPQGVLLIPETRTLVVASGEDGTCRFFNESLEVVGAVDGLADADNVRYDRARGWVYVAYGTGGLAIIDAQTRKQIASIPLPGHPESFQLEATGSHVFVNVPAARQAAVIDREKRTIVETWPITDAEQNYPMALDEANRRLFVGCRKPAKLLVLNTDSGKRVATLDSCGDADDIFLDAAARRIYVSGGEGCISVFLSAGPDSYKEVERVRTAPGARTALFVPQTRTLYLAVPHRDAQEAGIWVYQASPPAP